MTRPRRPARRARDILRHTQRRLRERYNANAHASAPHEIGNAIRAGRSFHIGWQNRGTVHAAWGSTGLCVVLYANGKVVTALPLHDPYLAALQQRLDALDAAGNLNERGERTLETIRAQRRQLDRPGRSWPTFRPRDTHEPGSPNGTP